MRPVLAAVVRSSSLRSRITSIGSGFFRPMVRTRMLFFIRLGVSPLMKRRSKRMSMSTSRFGRDQFSTENA